jgi:serine kinase of HPr protein (carbohydrate metabolism regulator)
MTAAHNHHASVVLLGDRGVMIRGPSGAGKTSLALQLLDRCRGGGAFGRLVCDDQALLSCRSGRLIARAPQAIAGLAEVRGLGPRAIAHEPAAVVDLIVDLVPAQDVPRFPERMTAELLGVELARLVLGARDLPASGQAVAAWLALPPFLAGAAP